MPKHSFALKMEIVNAYKKGDCGYGQLAARYSIDTMQIKAWIQTEKRHGAEGLRTHYRYHKVEFKMGGRAADCRRAVPAKSIRAFQSEPVANPALGAGLAQAWYRGPFQ